MEPVFNERKTRAWLEPLSRRRRAAFVLSCVERMRPSLVAHLRVTLSEMESSVLGFYLEDRSYEEVAELLGTDTKAVDNALQRVKRKVGRHLDSREYAV